MALCEPISRREQPYIRYGQTRRYIQDLETKDNILSYFSQEELDWELSKLKTNFGPGKYFTDLNMPENTILEDWVVRKFAEYALQALWIYEYFPSCILIQNEKPSFLRSKMYQPLVKESYKKSFPIAYFLGVDNDGFQ